MMSSSDAQTSRNPNGDPLVGQVFFDRYRVMRKLEDRNGGAVYFAQHLQADHAVAIEVLDTDNARPAAIDQFLEEARTVARIGHENVVEIFNGGRSTQGAVFLATEYLEGTTLAQTLTDGPLLWDRAQGILLQIAAALGAVHRHGIVHRDLKPENVLLVPRAGRRDFIKLLDFGVARVRASCDTDQGSLTGAPEYMAPEQAHAGPVDHRADVYSLGCLLVHMVTGQPPFVADSILDLLDKHQSETPAPPSSRRPAGTLPAELDAVVARALEKDPAQRWPDMAAFSDAIARCRLTRRQSVRVEALTYAELSGKQNAFEEDARRRHRWGGLLSVAAAVVLAIVGIRFIQTAQGHVQISTTPDDAALTFNGIPVQARSPVTLDAAPGRYVLVVSRPGYVSFERSIDVVARGTVNVPVELAPVAPTPVAQLPTTAGQAAASELTDDAVTAAAPSPVPAP